MEFSSCPLLGETIKFFHVFTFTKGGYCSSQRKPYMITQLDGIVVVWMYPYHISGGFFTKTSMPRRQSSWVKSVSRHSKVVSTTVFFFFLYHFLRSIEMDCPWHILSLQFCKFKKNNFAFSVMFQKWWWAFSL